MSRTKRILGVMGKWALICTITFGFLALCNWNFNMQDWTGFSRFILGAEGVIFLIDLMSEL
jgi:hypothetical protein